MFICVGVPNRTVRSVVLEYPIRAPAGNSVSQIFVSVSSRDLQRRAGIQYT
jgi:hypothetical protein